MQRNDGRLKGFGAEGRHEMSYLVGPPPCSLHQCGGKAGRRETSLEALTVF